MKITLTRVEEQAAPHLPEEYRQAAAEMLKKHRDVLAVF